MVLLATFCLFHLEATQQTLLSASAFKLNQLTWEMVSQFYSRLFARLL